MKKEQYTALGLMSGTSLDGLDMALCNFEFGNGKWHYKIEKSVTVEYSKELQVNLKKAYKSSASDLARLNFELGRFMGISAKAFLEDAGVNTDLVASHGHTVFHEPDQGYTCQIGSGAEIAAQTGLLTVCDFRTLDVARGGQGAPLVPIGDELLFGDYAACVNLGGFANISYNEKGQRIAYDICPVNFVLNRLAEILGYSYDSDGGIASEGLVLKDLLDKLNANPYFKLHPPKSLGQEWVEKEILPLINCEDYTQNIMATYVEHVSDQIAQCLSNMSKQKVLFTGGGVYNKYLLSKIKQKTEAQIIIPENELIEMKEALVFAFLGVLRLRNQVNSLASVTGASVDSINGAVYLP